VIVEELGAGDPTTPFLRTPRTEQSRGRVLESVRRTRDSLGALPPGSVVGLLARSDPDTVITLLGAWAARLVVLPLDPRLPSHTLSRTLKRAGACALLGDPDPTRVIVVGDTAGAMGPGEAAGVVSLVTTSGTSGDPKLVAHSWSQHLASADGITEATGFGEGHAWLLSLPLHHVSGLAIVVRALVRGGTVVMADDLSDLARTLTTLRPTHLSMVSTQLHRAFQDAATTDHLRSMRCVLAGGGPIPQPLRVRAVNERVPLMVSYGLTEMASTVTASGDPDVVTRPGSGGAVLPHRRLEVAADGVIRVGGDTLCAGYLEPDGVRDPSDGEGWFTTGDVGRLDDDGVLRVLGRRDAMFVSGGENVHPGEIEGMLLECDGVIAAVVVPIPHPEFGARPVAFVEMAAERTVDLRAHLSERLPRFKIPEGIYRMPSMTGIKPDRGALLALATDPTREEELETI